jgi:acyl-CoA thioesterase-1
VTTRFGLVGLLLLSSACGRPTAPEAPLVAFLGDSLTSGWKLGEAEAYPAVLERALAARHHHIRVLNAGVSGDTVAQGLARLPGVLRWKPDVLVVALGTNDGLRGLPLPAAEAGLREIVRRGQAAGARVLLVGVRLPPRRAPALGPGPSGDDYARRFAEIYPRLAAERRVALVPSLLEGVEGRPELNLPGGLHPTAEGHERLAENVRPRLEMLLAEVWAARSH